MVLEINGFQEFSNTIVTNSDKIILADFYADWCGPCKRIAPELEKLQAETPGLLVIKINVDKNDELAQYFQIGGLPTFHFFKHGQHVDKVVGASPSLIKEKTDKLLK